MPDWLFETDRCSLCGRVLDGVSPDPIVCAPCYYHRRKLTALAILSIEQDLLHMVYDTDTCPCLECRETRILLGRDNDETG